MSVSLYLAVNLSLCQGHSNVKLQLAATFCISNLIWNEEDGEGLNIGGEPDYTRPCQFQAPCGVNIATNKCNVSGKQSWDFHGILDLDCLVVLRVHCTMYNTLTIYSVSPGSQERQDKLRELGFVDILHKLAQSPDTNLCDR